MILEWEGLRYRRRRWDEAWGRGYPIPTGEGSGEGTVPPAHKIFRIFVENTIF